MRPARCLPDRAKAGNARCLSGRAKANGCWLGRGSTAPFGKASPPGPYEGLASFSGALSRTIALRALTMRYPPCDTRFTGGTAVMQHKVAHRCHIGFVPRRGIVAASPRLNVQARFIGRVQPCRWEVSARRERVSIGQKGAPVKSRTATNKSSLCGTGWRTLSEDQRLYDCFEV